MCGRRISESCEGGCADERGDGQVLPLLLGIPAEVLVPVGGFLVVYAASLWFLGTRARVSRPAVWVVVVGNLLWAAASVVTAAAGWWSPTAPRASRSCSLRPLRSWSSPSCSSPACADPARWPEVGTPARADPTPRRVDPGPAAASAAPRPTRGSARASPQPLPLLSREHGVLLLSAPTGG
jgi:hypothetical protein